MCSCETNIINKKDNCCRFHHLFHTVNLCISVYLCFSLRQGSSLERWREPLWTNFSKWDPSKGLNCNMMLPKTSPRFNLRNIFCFALGHSLTVGLRLCMFWNVNVSSLSMLKSFLQLRSLLTLIHSKSTEPIYYECIRHSYSVVPYRVSNYWLLVLQDHTVRLPGPLQGVHREQRQCSHFIRRKCTRQSILLIDLKIEFY